MMNFDVCVPAHKLICEYQGEYHYKDNFFRSGIEHIISKDEEKIKACEQNGFLIVVIPFWWDRRIESLSETIRKTKFPNIPMRNGDAISNIIPRSLSGNWWNRRHANPPPTFPPSPIWSAF